jgi:hypothetical protein
VAKIANIPVGTDELCVGDLVEFDSAYEIIRVLERGARTRQATYDPGPSDATANDRYLAVKAYLAHYAILTEGAANGVVALSVPNVLSDGQLAEICLGCPIGLHLAAVEGDPEVS